MIKIVGLRGKIWLMEKVARLYTEIFREEPWNENLNPAEIMAIMIEQFNKPRAVALVVLQNGEVIGFAWMYEIVPSDLEEGTRYSPELKFLFRPGQRVFYFQEVGVKREFRGQGIGEQLAREALEKGKTLGMRIAVLSTSREAAPALRMFSRLGFKDSGIVRPPEELGRTYWVLELEN